jgi:RND superfamily putative drug exporter
MPAPKERQEYGEIVIARLVKLAGGHPRRVLVAAGAVFAIAAALGVPVTTTLGSSIGDFQNPASQYERANAAIAAATGQNAYYNATALLGAPRDIASDPVAQRASATVATLLALQHGFQRVIDYAAIRSPALLSRDRRETAVLAAFATPTDATNAIARVHAALAKAPTRGELRGITVRFGGEALVNQELNERTTNDLARAELLAFPILLALSFWFFRGLAAALLPLLVGGFAIVLTFLLLRIVDQITPLSVFALNLVSGMGLGLGIDYSLFVLYRYREELAGGASAHEAIERTLRTTGRTVLFSCLTVAAAMTSLLVFPLRFLYSMGIGGALVTLCDGAVALLVLPALLVALGPRINAFSPAWLQRRASRSATAGQRREGGWWRLANGVVHRPAAVASVSAAVLVLAAIPALHVHFTSPGANLLPPTAESRIVENAFAANFAANAGEATEIVLPGTRASARRLAAAAGATVGARASVSAVTQLNRRTWEITLLPHGSPFANAQQQLLARLRSLARPYGGLIGGATAYFVDQKAAIAAGIPLALLILLPLTAGFLFAMTGSVTIPIKALAMNLLSVGVGTGLIVLIFQDGHLSGLLGFSTIGGLEESSLVLMLVLAFALATDYEVFVLARIKEAHDQGLPNREAIAHGIERTGRIITAAALLFCVAIGAMTTSNLFFTKQLGLGAALAVAIDASIVRALLVPSLMALMGDWNWWAPRALRRLHDRIGLREAPRRIIPHLESVIEPDARRQSRSEV